MEIDARKKPSRLMFMIWGGIGNMVMALPVINAARGSFPGEAFVLLAQKSVMLELWGEDQRTKKMCLDDPRFYGIAGKIRLLREIMELVPDAVISTVPSPRLRSGLLALFSGAGQRVCLQRYGSAFFNVQVPSGTRHYIHQNLGLLEPLGALTDKVEYSIAVSGKSQRMAEELYSLRGIGKDEKVVGIHPGAGDPHKRWPADKFMELGRGLIKAGTRPMVFGGPDETDLVKEVCDGIGRGAVGFTGSEDIQTTLAMIKRCRAFISNDSGLAHCAAALEIPTIVIFGPTDPEVCAPISSYVAIVKSDSRCGPCYRPANKFGCREYPLRCFKITVKDVLTAYDRLMRTGHE